jgi:hypothetical protein
MVIATLAALVCCGLLLGVALLFEPMEPKSIPASMQITSNAETIISALLYVGLAALISFVIVATGVLISRLRRPVPRKRVLSLSSPSVYKEMCPIKRFPAGKTR